MAVTGVVGSGKPLLLWRIQDQLRPEGQIEVAESLVFDVPRVTLNTLKLALYYDLATDKDGDLTGKPEQSERALLKVMHRCQKPLALFIDDGHDLHGQTRRSLKQFIERRGDVAAGCVGLGGPSSAQTRAAPAVSGRDRGADHRF